MSKVRALLLSLVALSCASCASYEPFATAVNAPPVFVDEVRFVQTEARVICASEFSPKLHRDSPALFQDAAGDVFVIWETGARTDTRWAYMLSVCYRGQWLEPQGLFPHDEGRWAYFRLQGMVDADGSFKVVQIRGTNRYELYAVHIDSSRDPPLVLELEQVVQIPPGPAHKADTGPVTAVLAEGERGGYLITGYYSERQLNPLLLFLPLHSVRKWFWCRLENGEVTRPRPVFKYGWFDAEPRPKAGRQLVLSADGKVHAVAGCYTDPNAPGANYRLVHGWLEENRWRIEEVYKGGRDATCNEPLVAVGGHRAAIAGTFRLRDTFWGVAAAVWCRDQEGWCLALTLKDAHVADFAADAAGHLYILYKDLHQFKLLTGSPGRWHHPIRLKCPGRLHGARLLVDDDGVVHIAAACRSPSSEAGEGYYLRLEPVQSVPGLAGLSGQN